MKGPGLAVYDEWVSESRSAGVRLRFWAIIFLSFGGFGVVCRLLVVSLNIGEDGK